MFRNRLFLQNAILRILIFPEAITFHSVPHSRTMIRPLFLPAARRPRFSTFCLLVLFAWCLLVPAPSRAGERFPLYPCIRANVAFWEDIYSRYTTRQGVLHDSTDLGRVYTVVDLVDWQATDAARINNERIHAARERVSDILTDLGDGKRPATRTEQHIASLFPPKRHTTFHKARENIRLQLGQKDRFYEGVVRSGKYLAQFKQHFVNQGLPPELAYLPHVESSFNPRAYSKAGAAGLWQFTRGTGREYMTVGEAVDERLDPYVATRAAARLLKTNYAQLKNWPLAITAYNHGRTGMLRAVREKGSYESIFRTYQQGSFQFASRNFYPEFLAAVRVAKRLAAVPGTPFERPEATLTFRLREDAPIGRLRSNFGISPAEFARLNPALRKPVLDGQVPVPKGYLVRLPKTSQVQRATAGKRTSVPVAKTVARNRVAAPPAVKAPAVASTSAAVKPAPRRTVRHTVRKGDTSFSIARQHQISLQDLMTANNRSVQEPIRIGETLIIPSRHSNLLHRKSAISATN